MRKSHLAPTFAGLTKLILDFVAGQMSYRALRRRMLARSPMLAARMLWAHLN